MCGRLGRRHPEGEGDVGRLVGGDGDGMGWDGMGRNGGDIRDDSS